MASERREAEILGTYLLGAKPSEQAVSLYLQAMQKLEITISGSDERLLKRMLDNPAMIGLVDSGLALIRPQSVIRRKLLVYLAILESLPEYAHLFLPSSTPALYPLYILWVGIRAAFKAVAGVIIVKLV